MGEYVGQRAAQAAQAVRRAGLRPGLNRSFGCEPELVGQVIAQEPTAGSELARNGLVTLYVAAPGAGPDELDPPAAELEQAGDAPGELDPSESEAPLAQPSVRRRRKPGRARNTPESFGTPPAPVAPGPTIDSETWEPELPVQAPEEDWTADLELPVPSSSEALPEEPLDCEGTEALYGEEFVVHADDVFAGRTEPAWRRVYPRTSRGATRLGVWRSRFVERPLVVKAAGVLLALWLVVALASTLAGSTGGTHRAASTATGLGRQHSTHTVSTTASAPAPRAPARRRPRHVHLRGVLPAHHHRRPVHARPVSVRPVRASPRAVVAPRAAEAPAVSAPAHPAPVPEQTQGGLFSP